VTATLVCQEVVCEFSSWTYTLRPLNQLQGVLVGCCGAAVITIVKSRHRTCSTVGGVCQCRLLCVNRTESGLSCADHRSHGNNSYTA